MGDYGGRDRESSRSERDRIDRDRDHRYSEQRDRDSERSKERDKDRNRDDERRSEREQKGPVEATGQKIGQGVNLDHQAQVINIRKVRKTKKKKVTNSISKKRLKKNRCNISI